MNPNEQNQNGSQEFFQPSVPENTNPAPGSTVVVPTQTSQNQNNSMMPQQTFNDAPSSEAAVASDSSQPIYPQNPSINNKQNKQSSNKKLLIIVVSSVVFLLIVTIIAVIAGSGSKKPTTQSQDTTAKQANTAIEPATSLGIEQVNNSINQDISGLNDENDLPQDQLSDESLGL